MLIRCASKPTVMRLFLRRVRRRIFLATLFGSALNLFTSLDSFSLMLWFFMMSVLTKPGATALTLIFFSSQERAVLKANEAAFDAV